MNKILTVSRASLLVVLCLLVMLTVVSAVARTVVLSPDTYTDFVDDDYISSLTVLVRDELEAECLFYDLPFDMLDKPLSNERITDYARQYTDAMAKTLLNGEAFIAPSADETAFVIAVQDFFDSLSESERPLDPNAAQTVGKELAAVATAELKVGLNDAWVKKAHAMLAHPWLLRVSNGFYILVSMTVIIAFAAYFLDKRRLYGVSLSATIGAALVAVPLFLLRLYDLPKRLALMDSPLKLYIDGVLNTAIGEAARLSLIVFAVMALLFVLSIFIGVLYTKSP